MGRKEQRVHDTRLYLTKSNLRNCVESGARENVLDIELLYTTSEDLNGKKNLNAAEIVFQQKALSVRHRTLLVAGQCPPI